MSLATVTRVGNSRAVVIPASIDDESFSLGTKVEVEHVGRGVIVIRVEDDDRSQHLAALDDLEDFSGTQPDVPWPDDSRQADRMLLETRYE